MSCTSLYSVVFERHEHLSCVAVCVGFMNFQHWIAFLLRTCCRFLNTTCDIAIKKSPSYRCRAICFLQIGESNILPLSNEAPESSQINIFSNIVFGFQQNNRTLFDISHKELRRRAWAEFVRLGAETYKANQSVLFVLL